MLANNPHHSMACWPTLSAENVGTLDTQAHMSAAKKITSKYRRTMLADSVGHVPHSLSLLCGMGTDI